jgi:hypothetical protein
MVHRLQLLALDNYEAVTQGGDIRVPWAQHARKSGKKTIQLHPYRKNDWNLLQSDLQYTLAYLGLYSSVTSTLR